LSKVAEKTKNKGKRGVLGGKSFHRFLEA